MICKALITGVEEISYKDKTDQSSKVFKKVNFIDTENKADVPQSVSFSKDLSPADLEKILAHFDANRMKVVPIHVFANGAYSNFGGFVS